MYHTYKRLSNKGTVSIQTQTLSKHKAYQIQRNKTTGYMEFSQHLGVRLDVTIFGLIGRRPFQFPTPSKHVIAIIYVYMGYIWDTYSLSTKILNYF